MTTYLMRCYPHLVRACEIIDADGGAHHIERIEPGSIEPLADRFARTVAPLNGADVFAWDAWLSTLSEEQIATVACGEESEAEALAALCPCDGITEFFTSFFEGA